MGAILVMDMPGGCPAHADVGISALATRRLYAEFQSLDVSITREEHRTGIACLKVTFQVLQPYP